MSIQNNQMLQDGIDKKKVNKRINKIHEIEKYQLKNSNKKRKNKTKGKHVSQVAQHTETSIKKI
jgi:NADPH-dependent glutamate synthase beta subunit-like oxidoreductase